MPRKKKNKSKKTEEYSFLAIQVAGYSAAVDASINYEVKKPYHCDEDARVYNFGSRLEINGICTYPETRQGEVYSITVYGSPMREGMFDLRLRDCHVRDDDWRPKYQKLRGQEVPVYDVPKNIGMLDRIRGSKNWTGWLWVPPRIVSDMLALLPHASPLYLEIYERREGRKHWLTNFSLQTNDPAEE